MQALEEQVRIEAETRHRELCETLRREREEASRLLGEAMANGSAEIARQRDALQALRQELEEERGRLRQQAVELEQRRLQVDIADGVCRQEKSSLAETTEARVREAVEEAERRCAQRDRVI